MPSGHQRLRAINRNNVLNIILRKGPISRVQLADLTGLTQSTVSKIVSQLIEEDLVYEASRDDSLIGRKPINLKIKGTYRIYGVIDVTLWTTTLAVCDLRGQFLDRRQIKTFGGDANRFFTTCAKTLSKMLKPFKEPCAGVSVIVPCMLNSTEGLIYWNNVLNWKDVNAKELVEKHVDCKVLIENDARAGALAELWFAEEANEISNFVFVLVCDGIGTGIVISKQLYYGAHFLDGQFYAEVIKIDTKGEDFSKKNTWENLASDFGTVTRYCELEDIPREQDTEVQMQRIIDLAKRGDYHATRALKETARYLGVGIANINNGLDPERIIVGGKVVQAWDIIFPEMIQQVESLTLYQVVPLRDLIIPSSLNCVTLEGARALILQDLFGGFVINGRQPYPGGEVGQKEAGAEASTV